MTDCQGGLGYVLETQTHNFFAFLMAFRKEFIKGDIK